MGPYLGKPNENSVEMHFTPFRMRYNALQRSTMIRNTLQQCFRMICQHCEMHWQCFQTQ